MVRVGCASALELVSVATLSSVLTGMTIQIGGPIPFRKPVETKLSCIINSFVSKPEEIKFIPCDKLTF